MRHAFTRALLLFAAVSLFAVAASADSIPVGIFSFDLTGPNTVQLDITNQTGPNSSIFPDTTWPVSSTIFLSSLSLTVHFADGSTQTFGSSFFTLSSDGISFTGSPMSALNLITSATLTGKFSTTTFNLNNGTTVTVINGFTVTLTDPTGGPLQNGDAAVIYALTGKGTVPEPDTWTLMGTGL